MLTTNQKDWLVTPLGVIVIFALVPAVVLAAGVVWSMALVWIGLEPILRTMFLGIKEIRPPSCEGKKAFGAMRWYAARTVLLGAIFGFFAVRFASAVEISGWITRFSVGERFAQAGNVTLAMISVIAFVIVAIWGVTDFSKKFKNALEEEALNAEIDELTSAFT